MSSELNRSLAPLTVSTGMHHEPERVMERLPTEIDKLISEMTYEERAQALAIIGRTVGAKAIELLKDTRGTPQADQARDAGRIIAQAGNWVSSELISPSPKS